jgi:phenylacetate-CoA ligase
MHESATSAEALRRAQLQSLNELLQAVFPSNAFYTRKLGEKPAAFASVDHYSGSTPLTLKAELAADQSDQPPYGRNLTFPLDAYSRLHQTSGTTGKPLRWLDTPETWEMLVNCWTEVYRAAGVTSKDAVYFAFSFGPFLGFWLAFDAANRLGCLCIPGGGQTSLARLHSILDLKATVLCCTPSYALHLAEVAAREQVDLSRSHVRVIMVAGEAGGSIPATREQIQRLWPGARVSDHHGMTEVGAVSYECPAQPCRLHIIDWAYLAEVIDPETLRPVPIGTPGELVLTTLKRVGSPLLRYRTGDLVKIAAHHKENAPCACGTFNTTLEGGILGRSDDMVVVRGVNVYPTAVEQIVRQFREIAEFRAQITHRGALSELRLTIEPQPHITETTALIDRVEKAFQGSLNLRIPVAIAPAGSLPRAELKARRWSKEHNPT